MEPIRPGDVVLVDLGATIGREQSGRRPAVIVSSTDHLAVADQLATVMLCTTRERGWLNHIELGGTTGLPSSTFALTEQLRTIDRHRILRRTGSLDANCFEELLHWMRRWVA